MRNIRLSRPQILTAFLFVCFCIFAFCFPYSGDDLFWGSQHGLDLLANFFQGYNGRYLGNLLVLAITRSKLLDAFVMGACFTWACWICFKYTKEQHITSYFLAAVLFFLIPKSVGAQALLWSAGFANYVPSACISAAYLLLTKNITDTAPPSYHKYASLGTFLMGFLGALFMENITLFNICLAVAVIGYTWLKFRRVFSAHVGFLMGAILGAVTLFSNPCYFQVASDTDSYRHVTQTVYESIIYCVKNANQLLDYLIYENIVFCLIVTLLLVILVCHRIRNSVPSKGRTAAKIFLVIHILSTAVVSFFHQYPDALYRIPCDLGIYPFLVEVFLILIALVYIATIVAEIYLCIPKECQFHMLIPLYCVPVALAPLLLVDPIGPRNVFFAYLLMMLFTTELFGHVWANCISGIQIRKTVYAGICAVLLLQVLVYGAAFLSIRHWDTERSVFAKWQSDNGSSTIYLCDLPYHESMHKTSPDAEPWATYYKQFYGLREDVSLEFVSREELATMIHQKTP